MLSGSFEMRLSVLEEGWLVAGFALDGGDGVEDVDNGETGAGEESGEVLMATRLPVMERREACAAGLLSVANAALEEAIVGAMKRGSDGDGGVACGDGVVETAGDGVLCGDLEIGRYPVLM